MEEKHACLVLEGGAMRGVYTSGVQGVLHRSKLSFDGLIGTSAGAMNGANLLAGQPERSFFIDHHFSGDKKFMGLGPLLREGQIFSFQYMFTTVNDAYPLDLASFESSPVRLIAVATDAETGKPAYLEKANCSDMVAALVASGSMPLLSTPVSLDGRAYYDGGPSMAVGYRKAMEDGYDKVVLILTRQKGYRKAPLSPAVRLAVRRKFRHHPDFREMMLQSPAWYNRMMDEIDLLEREGRIFVIRPSVPVTISRMEKDQKKLEALFQLGQADATVRLHALRAYLGTPEVAQ